MNLNKGQMTMQKPKPTMINSLFVRAGVALLLSASLWCLPTTAHAEQGGLAGMTLNDWLQAEQKLKPRPTKNNHISHRKIHL